MHPCTKGQSSPERCLKMSQVSVLWLGGDKRGGYTTLRDPPAAMLRGIGEEPCQSFGVQGMYG